MKGTIFLPAQVSRDRHPADLLSVFTEKLSEKFDWKIICSNKLSIDEIEGNILFLVKTPQKDYPEIVDRNFISINKNIKVISYFQDIHLSGNYNVDLKYQNNMVNVLDRSDLILYSYKEAFRKKWPTYFQNAIWCPTFIAPSERYLNLPFNNFPKNKCLLIGASVKSHYPLRHAVSQSKSELFEIIRHPGYNINPNNDKMFIRDNYAKKLNEYLCCLSCTMTTQYVVTKFFEILGSGSILISDWIPEMSELGFRNGKNFIQVNINNFEEKVGDIIENPSKYKHIRNNGRELVKNFHTVEHRIGYLEKLLKERNWI